MDDADRAQVDAERLEASDIARARALAAKIPPGEPGVCDYCGEEFPRLVNGACGRCRDKFKLG